MSSSPIDEEYLIVILMSSVEIPFIHFPVGQVVTFSALALYAAEGGNFDPCTTGCKLGYRTKLSPFAARLGSAKVDTLILGEC